MNNALQAEVRHRAGDICEYCRLAESASELRHVIDHIIARQHGGWTTSDNLALACGRCNRHKGPNVAGVDPHTAKLTRLFNPRSDLWSDHFQWQGAYLIPLTDVGRTTIHVLAMNDPYRIALRTVLFNIPRRE
jgi:hypothetical protein